jgi:hypothetical protein
VYKLGDDVEAEREAASLANVYYKVVGITFAELFAKNIPDIVALLRERNADAEEVKRLADALFLYFLARNKRNIPSTREVLNAHKLYAATGFMASAIRAGQEAADQSLTLTADPNIARQILESVLSMVEGYGLLEYLVPVRAHHAVILAYCGQIDRARTVMRELAPFVPDLEPTRREDVVRQTVLIEEIARGRIRLKRQASPRDSLNLLFSRKGVGRNELCPCGSGLKYKKCHG